jgi:hypothetical protein
MHGLPLLYIYLFIYLFFFDFHVYHYYPHSVVRLSLRWPRDTIYPQKLALNSPTSGGRSVGIVRLRTKIMEFVFVCLCGKTK